LLQDIQDSRFQIFSHTSEPEDISENFVSDLDRTKLFVIENMFLEELSLPIHVTAIEDTVAVDLLILESSRLLRLQVGVGLSPQVVLVRFQVVLLRLLLLVEFILMLGVSFVEGALQFAETV